MLKICAKGHYELAFNSINTLHEPLECPACEALADKARLEDEFARALVELDTRQRAIIEKYEGHRS